MTTAARPSREIDRTPLAESVTAVRRFKPYPAYKDFGIEWLGELPSHWEVAPVYARYEVALGKMLDAKRVTGECSGPYLRNVDVQWDVVNVEALPKMDFAPLERERYLLRSGDLVVCEGGEVGRTAIWRGELAECFYQKAIHRVRPRSEGQAPRFFYYLMHTLAKRGVFVAGGNPNTIDHLTAVQLRHYRLPFAPFHEQRAIAGFLDRETARIDALVAKKERLIALLQEQRTALITRAVTKGLDPSVPMKDSGVEWLGKIPTEWSIKRLKLITKFRGGGTPTKDNLEYWRGEIPWVSPKDMKVSVVLDTEDKITEKAVRDSATKRIPAGAVLVVVRSGILVHSIPVALAGREVTLNQDLKALIPSAELLPQYLMYLVSGMQRQLLLEWKKEGATVESLELELIANSPTPLPTIAEQRAIATFLDRETARIDAMVAKVSEAIDRLTEFRLALVSAAVTGKIDVREEVA